MSEKDEKKDDKGKYDWAQVANQAAAAEQVVIDAVVDTAISMAGKPLSREQIAGYVNQDRTKETYVPGGIIDAAIQRLVGYNAVVRDGDNYKAEERERVLARRASLLRACVEREATGNKVDYLVVFGVSERPTPLDLYQMANANLITVDGTVVTVQMEAYNNVLRTGSEQVCGYTVNRPLEDPKASDDPRIGELQGIINEQQATIGRQAASINTLRAWFHDKGQPAPGETAETSSVGNAPQPKTYTLAMPVDDFVKGRIVERIQTYQARQAHYKTAAKAASSEAKRYSEMSDTLVRNSSGMTVDWLVYDSLDAETGDIWIHDAETNRRLMKKNSVPAPKGIVLGPEHNPLYTGETGQQAQKKTGPKSKPEPTDEDDDQGDGDDEDDDEEDEDWSDGDTSSVEQSRRDTMLKELDPTPDKPVAAHFVKDALAAVTLAEGWVTHTDVVKAISAEKGSPLGAMAAKEVGRALAQATTKGEILMNDLGKVARFAKTGTKAAPKMNLEDDLSAHQALVLQVIRGGAQTIADIANAAQCSVTDATATVETLAARGLVVKKGKKITPAKPKD